MEKTASELELMSDEEIIELARERKDDLLVRELANRVDDLVDRLSRLVASEEFF